MQFHAAPLTLNKANLQQIEQGRKLLIRGREDGCREVRAGGHGNRGNRGRGSQLLKAALKGLAALA